MSNGNGSGDSATPSWWIRLGQVLSGEPRDRAEFVEFLRDAEDRNLFDAEALSIMEGALQVGEIQVRDIMVPRAQMVVVEVDAAPEQLVGVAVESGHSRFPVVGDSRDDVRGILLAKDLLAFLAATGESGQFDIEDTMRPVVFIPESKRLNMLLREFRANRNHMAIVVDEYEGVAGLVTIEDVLEQIVGEIDDEHDVDEDDGIRALGDGEHVVKALTPIDEFNEHFGTAFSDAEFDTVGGLVVKAFGHFPKRGETCRIDGVNVEVLRADRRRVHLLRVNLAAEVAGDESGEEN